VVELKLPELGEDIEAVEVVQVLVQAGDRVELDQPVIEVETEKANLEVPSNGAGVIAEVLVRAGDRIRVGQTILNIDSDAAAASPAESPEQPGEREEASAAQQPPDGDEVPDGPSPAPATGPADTRDPVSPPPATPVSTGRREIGATVPAAPSVRALARELGVDPLRVRGSGPGGRISRDDVKAYAKNVIRTAAGTKSAGLPGPELPDFSKWGEVVRERWSNVRRATVASMATAWSQVPHVTQFDHADVTQLDGMRRTFNQRPEVAERKLSMTAIVVKTVAAALKQFPKFNASLDVIGEEAILKKYVHVGVAVDTERGLLVPVIRDADRKNLLDLSTELTDLAGRARSKKLGLEEMRGASFTVSNLGGLGTTYFSPIVPWPQVAILGVGRAEQRATWVESRFEPRWIMPLSVSYDHRWIDGADAARFLRWLAEGLEQPLMLLIDE
jgi:pyruvate dehydrogenase E2 component (dihydrolipoamide acetyltransferase)